jgi:AcrR family transcriptional regulator
MKHKSQSVSKLTGNDADSIADARVRKTRNKIDEAFLKLLFHRSYQNLRVSDVIRKAAIGRATFYAHFSSKDDLLKAQVNRVVIPMLKSSPDSPCLVDCRALFAHARAAPQLFRAIMSEGEGSGLHVVRDAMEVWLDELPPAQKPIVGRLPAVLVKRFVFSTLLTIIAHGLRSGATDSAEAMQNQFEKLVGSGLSA